MTYREVKQALQEPTESPKQIRLNDGTRYVVRDREHGPAAGDDRVVIAGKFDEPIAYRDIAVVRITPRRRPSEP